MRKGKTLIIMMVLAFAFQSAGAAMFDNDKDGIANAQDLCPKTPASVKVDRFGCSDDFVINDL